jgi:type VI secretion system protein ImpH
VNAHEQAMKAREQAVNAHEPEADKREPAANARAQALWHALADEPYRFDLLAALRAIDAAHPDKPRLGTALRPSDEPVRVGQEASLTFAPATISSIDLQARIPRLVQRAFGLLGPNGPMPTHLTEHTHQRTHHHGDVTLQRFLDALTHRFALLFYRAWAQAQPVVAVDRPNDTRYARWLGSLFGNGGEDFFSRDALGDDPKLHFAGRLARGVRDADGLAAWIHLHFAVKAHVECWCGHWMRLDAAQRTAIGSLGSLGAPQGVGRGAVLGGQVWDVQHKFRIVIGPLRWQRYLGFLPGGKALDELRAMVRQYVGFEFEWDVRLILAHDDVPRLRVAPAAAADAPADAAHGALGRTAWLGRRQAATDADPLVLNVESVLAARERRARAQATDRSKGKP